MAVNWRQQKRPRLLRPHLLRYYVARAPGKMNRKRRIARITSKHVTFRYSLGQQPSTILLICSEPNEFHSSLSQEPSLKNTAIKILQKPGQ